MRKGKKIGAPAAIAQPKKKPYANPKAAHTAQPPAVGERVWPLGVAGLIVGLLYLTHLVCCQRSVLPYFDAAFTDSDMYANLQWAATIRAQGWLNPYPFHPYNSWMRPIGTHAEWVQWWGGEHLFQQSPLYAYVLSVFLNRLLWMRIVQAFMSIGTCIFLGLLTYRISGRAAGWTAFWIAAFYAPFYLYSWPFLRDGMGWFITAALLWALSELTSSPWPSRHSSRFAWLVGFLLGLGFLTRETYFLLIPLVWTTLAGFAWKRRNWSLLPRVVITTLIIMSPLVIRNYRVHAPVLSTSNRFSETFIMGNAGSSVPNAFDVPEETENIFRETGGHPLAVIQKTIASHPSGIWGWAWLQVLKMASLCDPFELPDNLSFYFVDGISPVVWLGVRYWMVLVPGLAGLVLSIKRRERTHLWLWINFPVILASALVGVTVSRYRQALMLFFIPWAAYFLTILVNFIRRAEYRPAISSIAALLVGYTLVLGPLAQQPSDKYQRSAEYVLAIQIYHQLGQEQKAQAMRALARQRLQGLD